MRCRFDSCQACFNPTKGVGDIFRMIVQVKNFIGEVLAEMKKVSWVTGQELLDSTLVVIASSFILGLFVAAIDFVLSKGVAHLLR